MTSDELLTTCDTVLGMVGDRAEASVVAASGPDALTRFAQSFIHQNVAEADTTVSLRIASDGRTAVSSTTRVDEAGLRALVERTIDAAALRPPDPEYPGMAPAAAVAGDAHWDDATAEVPPEARAEAVRAFVDAGPELEAAGYVATKAKHAAFVNTSGQRLTGCHTSAVVDGIHRSANGDGAGRAAAVSIRDLDTAAAGARAAEKARAQAGDLLDIEPGHYEVVLEPGCLANMLLFLGYAGFNAKSLADGTSFVHLGEQQFDEQVSIWDDAHDPRTVGYLYDAEGTPKQRVDLVTRGRTTGVVHDRRTAAKAGVDSTGHGTGDESAGAGPSNVFFGAGDQTPDDLIARVERGLLVTDFHYTRILDPKTQVVTGLTRNGLFLIERGEVTGAVRNVRFTQSYVAALGPGKVLGVGNDAQLITGSQLGGFSHVPTVRLASWNVTGGARG
jgi:predicted Zn-dependent protease